MSSCPRHLRSAVLLAGLLALAACHRSGKGEDQRTAVGQVFSGSVTDAMLPYDSLRSQPQLAPARAAAASAAATDGATDAAPAGDPGQAGFESEVKGLPGR